MLLQWTETPTAPMGAPSPSSLTMSVCSNRAPTSSLDSPCHCLTFLTVKTFFSHIQSQSAHLFSFNYHWRPSKKKNLGLGNPDWMPATQPGPLSSNSFTAHIPNIWASLNLQPKEWGGGKKKGMKLECHRNATTCHRSGRELLWYIYNCLPFVLGNTCGHPMIQQLVLAGLWWTALYGFWLPLMRLTEPPLCPLIQLRLFWLIYFCPPQGQLCAMLTYSILHQSRSREGGGKWKWGPEGQELSWEGGGRVPRLGKLLLPTFLPQQFFVSLVCVSLGGKREGFLRSIFLQLISSGSASAVSSLHQGIDIYGLPILQAKRTSWLQPLLESHLKFTRPFMQAHACPVNWFHSRQLDCLSRDV